MLRTMGGGFRRSLADKVRYDFSRAIGFNPGKKLSIGSHECRSGCDEPSIDQCLTCCPTPSGCIPRQESQAQNGSCLRVRACLGNVCAGGSTGCRDIAPDGRCGKSTAGPAARKRVEWHGRSGTRNPKLIHESSGLIPEHDPMERASCKKTMCRCR